MLPSIKFHSRDNRFAWFVENFNTSDFEWLTSYKLWPKCGWNLQLHPHYLIHDFNSALGVFKTNNLRNQPQSISFLSLGLSAIQREISKGETEGPVSNPHSHSHRALDFRPNYLSSN